MYLSLKFFFAVSELIHRISGSDIKKGIVHYESLLLPISCPVDYIEEEKIMKSL